MKKKNTNAVIKMLAITIMAVAASFKPAFCQEPAIDNDLITYSMAVSPVQKVKFRLPLDIRSGDMITGTVVEEKKSTKEEVNNASSSLQGVVIEIDGKQTKLSNRIISFLVPAGITSLPFLLKNAAGQVIDQGQIPINSYFDTRWQEPVGFPSKFSPEVLGQPGKALRVTGSFDGNAANTNVSLGGQNCEVIAESNRMSIVQVPQNATAGVSNLKVEENNTKVEQKVNIARLNLSTNKTTLRKGQKATITVTVSGLENFDFNKNNIKLHLENQSPQTISFTNESGNIITKEINTIPVKNGVYEFSTRVIAVTTGTYTVKGDLMGAGDDCIIKYQTAVAGMEKLRGEELKKCEEKGGDINACKSAVNKMVDDSKKVLYDAFVDCMTKNK